MHIGNVADMQRILVMRGATSSAQPGYRWGLSVVNKFDDTYLQLHIVVQIVGSVLIHRVSVLEQSWFRGKRTSTYGAAAKLVMRILTCLFMYLTRPQEVE
jgi:hypothetical protein